jgi:hypothetical protein
MHVLLQSEVIDVVEVKGRQVPKRTGVGVGRSAAFSVGAQNLAAGDFSMWIWRRLVRPATKRHPLLQLPTVHTNKQSKWVAGMCPTSYGDCETPEEMLTSFVL